jgi:hypothetical protein
MKNKKYRNTMLERLFMLSMILLTQKIIRIFIGNIIPQRVIPAKAGIQSFSLLSWIPASAGMTEQGIYNT